MCVPSPVRYLSINMSWLVISISKSLTVSICIYICIFISLCPGRKPYALAVQQGSPLKDQLNDAWVELHDVIFVTILIFGVINFLMVAGLSPASYSQDLEAVEPEETGNPEGEMVEPESSEEGSQTHLYYRFFYPLLSCYLDKTLSK